MFLLITFSILYQKDIHSVISFKGINYGLDFKYNLNVSPHCEFEDVDLVILVNWGHIASFSNIYCLLGVKNN